MATSKTLRNISDVARIEYEYTHIASANVLTMWG